MSTFLFKNGVVLPAANTPPISTFLATHSGAYTTTRTHNSGETVLFYDRHLNRLANSLRFLIISNPRLVFGPQFSSSNCVPPCVSLGLDLDLMIRRRIDASMCNVMPVAMNKRGVGEEFAISALIGGNEDELRRRIDNDDGGIETVFDVYLHIGMYVPPVFGVVGNGARLAVVGNKRDFAEAKYSDWARLRKPLEKLRPPSTTELLLSDDNGRILEGTITNFFVVCFKGKSDIKEGKSHDEDNLDSYEIQTAPVNAGVLPGIIRQLVLEICLSKGITVREVSASWLERGNWEEAFITNSLRLVQHVESIQAPSSRASMETKSWEDVSWTEKQFKAGPGFITTLIQREIMKKADLEGRSLAL